MRFQGGADSRSLDASLPLGAHIQRYLPDNGANVPQDPADHGEKRGRRGALEVEDRKGRRHSVRGWRCVSSALASDSARQLHVAGHDGDALGVQGAQVGVFEEADEVGLGRLL
jgi:hypothetical protein